MKVQKVNEDKSIFKPFKINIEISVESEDDQRVLLKLKHIASELYLSNENGDCLSTFKSITNENEESANSLIQNILSNL